MSTIKCELCKRLVSEITKHHLIPKICGGKHSLTISVCLDCNKQIHALHDNRMLATSLNTLEALSGDENISKYLKWIRKKPEGTITKAKRSKDTKDRGRIG